MRKLYQFWLGIGLFVLALLLGWGLPMILPSTPHNGILITIIGVLVSAPFFVWAYILYRRQSIQIDVIIQELQSKVIAGFSMLEIFDALRDSFALGLNYSQVHDILVSKLPRVVGWGLFSSDILATFTTMGLIHTTSIDEHYPTVRLDFKYTTPNYVYQLTDNGKLLSHKLMNQKPKTRKGDSQP